MKIAVGGMIASGKTTLAEMLGKSMNLPVLYEFENDDKVFDKMLEWQYQGLPNTSFLLQIYFIHNLYQRQKELDSPLYIADRDLIEHAIFAELNLKHDVDSYLLYRNLYLELLTKMRQPDLYIILDISWEEFMKRITARSRKAEMKNFNEEYFRSLHKTYIEKLVQQCERYYIPYIVINVDDLKPEEVLMKAKEVINRKWSQE